VLGLVDDDGHGVDEDAPKLEEKLASGDLRIGATRRCGQDVPDAVCRSGYGVADRGHEGGQQPARLSFATGARHPRRRRSRPPEGVLEQGRLAVARVGDEEDGAVRQGPAHGRDQARPFELGGHPCRVLPHGRPFRRRAGAGYRST
jgi:hypothetical protein